MKHISCFRTKEVLMNWNTFYKMLSDFNDMSVVIRIFLAMFFGGFIGIEREKAKDLQDSVHIYWFALVPV